MAAPRDNLSAAKRSARLRIREQRQSRSTEHHLANDRAIALNAAIILSSLPPRSRVACYLSAPTEPGTRCLIADLHDQGFEVIAPRVRGPLLDWAIVSPDSDFLRGAFGIREVVGETVGVGAEPLQVAAAIFLPALAIDSQSGVRLGQGGGYYDAVLGSSAPVSGSGLLRAAILYSDEMWAGVPHDGTDCSVTTVITEDGVYEVARSGSRVESQRK